MLKRLFGTSSPDPKFALLPLYDRVVSAARQPHWYEQGEVPDTIDGRFDMVAAILSLVLLRLENEPGHAQAMVHLTEVFVDDMDGQLREVGIGDMIVGKHIGKIMSAVGGRLGAFRDAGDDTTRLDEVIARNIYRDGDASREARAHVRQSLIAMKAALLGATASAIVAGEDVW